MCEGDVRYLAPLSAYVEHLNPAENCNVRYKTIHPRPNIDMVLGAILKDSLSDQQILMKIMS